MGLLLPAASHGGGVAADHVPEVGSRIDLAVLDDVLANWAMVLTDGLAICIVTCCYGNGMSLLEMPLHAGSQIQQTMRELEQCASIRPVLIWLRAPW